jgi:hypothetical protein
MTAFIYWLFIVMGLCSCAFGVGAVYAALDCDYRNWPEIKRKFRGHSLWFLRFALLCLIAAHVVLWSEGWFI